MEVIGFRSIFHIDLCAKIMNKKSDTFQLSIFLISLLIIYNYIIFKCVAAVVEMYTITYFGESLGNYTVFSF